MKFIAFLSCLLVLITGVSIGTAIAKDRDPAQQCIREAAKDYQECRKGCQTDFKDAKDICRDVDHSCAVGCATGLEQCEEIPLTTLQSCKNNCNSTLDADKQNCRSQNPKGTEALDSCIDQAQVDAFLCRDECREGVSGALQQCRVVFRTCIGACPSPAR